MKWHKISEELPPKDGVYIVLARKCSFWKDGFEYAAGLVFPDNMIGYYTYEGRIREITYLKIKDYKYWAKIEPPETD